MWGDSSRKTCENWKDADVEEDQEGGAALCPLDPLESESSSSSTEDSENTPQAAVLEQSPLCAHAPADTAAAVPHSTGESGTVLPRPRVLLAIYPQFPRGGCCSNTRGRGSNSGALQACWLAVHSNVNVQPCCAEPSEALKLLSAGRE